MAELPPMIADLALILMVAGVVTLIFKKLKQPLVLGYIVAGFLVSPNMPYTASVVDMANVHLWADIGGWDSTSRSRRFLRWAPRLSFRLSPSYSV